MDITLLPSVVNPWACSKTDDYVVHKLTDDTTGEQIETHFTAERAEKAAQILADHARKNGLNDVYFWKFCPANAAGVRILRD